jgi:hypothetical protein
MRHPDYKEIGLLRENAKRAFIAYSEASKNLLIARNKFQATYGGKNYIDAFYGNNNGKPGDGLSYSTEKDANLILTHLESRHYHVCDLPDVFMHRNEITHLSERLKAAYDESEAANQILEKKLEEMLDASYTEFLKKKTNSFLKKKHVAQ